MLSSYGRQFCSPAATNASKLVRLIVAGDDPPVTIVMPDRGTPAPSVNTQRPSPSERRHRRCHEAGAGRGQAPPARTLPPRLPGLRGGGKGPQARIRLQPFRKGSAKAASYPYRPFCVASRPFAGVSATICCRWTRRRRPARIWYWPARKRRDFSHRMRRGPGIVRCADGITPRYPAWRTAGSIASGPISRPRPVSPPAGCVWVKFDEMRHPAPRLTWPISACGRRSARAMCWHLQRPTLVGDGRAVPRLQAEARQYRRLVVLRRAPGRQGHPALSPRFRFAVSSCSCT